jgi:ABC-type polysaccharide/polyol phosphate export permease
VLSRLLHFRGLHFTLTSRELKARYRGSLLGFLWSLVNPLLLLAVYTVVFDLVFKNRAGGAQPYAVFLLSGLFAWIWFSSALLDGTVSLSANAGLLRKAVFPAEVLPVVSTLASLAHYLLALPVLLLALAALNVHFKDVRDLLANLLTLAFFLTPILYPLETVAGVRPLLLLVRANPVTPFIRLYQELLFFGRLPPAGIWLQAAGLALAAWAVGSWLFERLSPTLVEAV